jgi:hypothetical protein
MKYCTRHYMVIKRDSVSQIPNNYFTSCADILLILQENHFVVLTCLSICRDYVTHFVYFSQVSTLRVRSRSLQPTFLQFKLLYDVTALFIFSIVAIRKKALNTPEVNFDL